MSCSLDSQSLSHQTLARSGAIDYGYRNHRKIVVSPKRLRCEGQQSVRSRQPNHKQPRRPQLPRLPYARIIRRRRSRGVEVTYAPLGLTIPQTILLRADKVIE